MSRSGVTKRCDVFLSRNIETIMISLGRGPVLCSSPPFMVALMTATCYALIHLIINLRNMQQQAKSNIAKAIKKIGLAKFLTWESQKRGYITRQLVGPGDKIIFHRIPV